MSILHKPHSPNSWLIPDRELDAMMKMFNKQNGAGLDDPIDIRVRNQFYKLEACGKRAYKDAMTKIGVEV